MLSVTEPNQVFLKIYRQVSSLWTTEILSKFYVPAFWWTAHSYHHILKEASQFTLTTTDLGNI